MHNQYIYSRDGEEIAMTWKIGKFWLATNLRDGKNLGAFKSSRKAHAAVLKSLDIKARI